MEEHRIIKIILFNILVVLTIVFIYLLLFPKKSYISKKLTVESNLHKQEVFQENINNMKISSEEYFKNNNKDKVTLKELIDNKLSSELLDENGNSCNKESYVQKQENNFTIYLECDNITDTIEIKDIKQEKLLCIYQYKKETKVNYTNWSEWSEWQLEQKEKSELVNVETKIEKELVGTRTVTDTKQISENAKENKKYICPNGYEVYNGKCVKKIKLNDIKAFINYICPEGYSTNGTNCYKNEKTVSATKKYFCPDDQLNIKYELYEDTCTAYRTLYTDITNTEIYYTCPNGYKLNDKKCYKSIEYEHEVEDYKETTYYRYQTRKKEDKKIDIKWGKLNDNNLINDEYNMVGKVTCEF